MAYQPSGGSGGNSPIVEARMGFQIGSGRQVNYNSRDVSRTQRISNSAIRRSNASNNSAAAVRMFAEEERLRRARG